jgi:hypothetical protein
MDFMCCRAAFICVEGIYPRQVNLLAANTGRDRTVTESLNRVVYALFTRRFNLRHSHVSSCLVPSCPILPFHHDICFRSTQRSVACMRQGLARVTCN